MTGTQDFENKYALKIEKLISENQEKPFLNGFRYFLGELAVSSVYNYLTIVNAFINYVGKQPKDLILDDYTIYLGTLKNRSSSYRITSYSALKKFSKYLLANQTNALDPMQYVSRPKYQEKIETVEKRNNGYLDKREIKKLKKSVLNGAGSRNAISYQSKWRERDIAIVMVFLGTGLRCSALCKLDIDNINMKNKSLSVVEKGGKIRECLLTGTAWDALENWLFIRENILSIDKDVPAIFVSNRKKRISTDAVSDIISKYAKDITGKNITPHKLRATYGTQLYNETHDIYFVKEAMGHSSIAATQRYIRGNQNKTKRASEIMDKLI